MSELTKQIEAMEYRLVDQEKTIDCLRHDRDLYKEKLAELRADQQRQRVLIRVHVVQPGDTLSEVARRYNLTDWNDIARLNRLNEPGHIQPGWLLMIPGTLQAG